jgi:hypothetical protein
MEIRLLGTTVKGINAHAKPHFRKHIHPLDIHYLSTIAELRDDHHKLPSQKWLHQQGTHMHETILERQGVHAPQQDHQS